MAGRFNAEREGWRKVKIKVKGPDVSTNLNANINAHRQIVVLVSHVIGIISPFC